MAASDADAESPPPPGLRLVQELTGSLLPQLVADGTFGDDWSLDEAKAVPIGGLGEDHWASTTLAVTLQLSGANNNADKR